MKKIIPLVEDEANRSQQASKYDAGVSRVPFLKVRRRQCSTILLPTTAIRCDGTGTIRRVTVCLDHGKGCPSMAFRLLGYHPKGGGQNYLSAQTLYGGFNSSCDMIPIAEGIGSLGLLSVISPCTKLMKLAGRSGERRDWALNGERWLFSLVFVWLGSSIISSERSPNSVVESPSWCFKSALP